MEFHLLLLLQVFKLLNVIRMASEVTATECDSVPAAPSNSVDAETVVESQANYLGWLHLVMQ